MIADRYLALSAICLPDYTAFAGTCQAPLPRQTEPPALGSANVHNE
jgi:hypothetical protein